MLYRVNPEDDLESPEAVKQFSRVCMVLLAWEAGELTQGQACALIGFDPVTVREMRAGVIEAAQAMWKQYREQNPPQWTQE